MKKTFNPFPGKAKIESLSSFENLRAVYLWKTHITLLFFFSWRYNSLRVLA
jgi:hypothetical protein